MTPAELVRSTRERLGLSQRTLALRAGTTQAAVSRIERGIVSPTYVTLRELMISMGEEPVLSSKRLPTDWDPVHMASTQARTHEERLALAISWNGTAGRLAAAGRASRAQADITPPDAEPIVAVLDAHKVEYVVVGGIAVQAHGHVRMTNDVDLIPSPTAENIERLAHALVALGASVLNPGSEHIAIDARMLPRATLWQLSTHHGDIYVLHDAPGVAPFPQLRERALVIALGEHELPIVSRDDLIKMKRAAGRPADLADIAALTEPEHHSADARGSE